MCNIHGESPDCACPAWLVATGEVMELVEADLEREEREGGE